MRVTRSLLHAAARCAVALYPADFRARFGGAMRQAFVDRVADRARSTSPIAATGFAVVALWNIAANGAAERCMPVAARPLMNACHSAAWSSTTCGTRCG
jgi:hypothetical protein